MKTRWNVRWVLGLVVLLTGLQPASGYYAPGVQRWINRDPIGEPGFGLVCRRKPNPLRDGPNEYLLVRNNPIGRADSFGLLAWPPIPIFYACLSINLGRYYCIGQFTPPTFCPRDPLQLIACLQNAKINMDVGCLTADPRLFDVGCRMIGACLRAYW